MLEIVFVTGTVGAAWLIGENLLHPQIKYGAREPVLIRIGTIWLMLAGIFLFGFGLAWDLTRNGVLQ